MIYQASTAEELVEDTQRKLHGMDVREALQKHGQATADAIHRLEQNGGLPLVDLSPMLPEAERPSF